MSSTTDEKSHFPLIPVPSSATSFDFMTDIADSFYLDMTLIHNTFIRAMNSVYYYAPRVKKDDEVAFAGYALAFTETLHYHHHGEEEILFPFLQEKNDMRHNVEQHDDFRKPMEAFDEYMKDIYEGRGGYSADKVRDLLLAFGSPVVEHLHEEIPTISPERMTIYSKDELSDLVKRQEEHIKTFPLFRSHPFVLTHHDSKSLPAWPPVPSHVKWMARNALYWWHKSYWRFSPFTRYGEPQEYTGA